MSRPDPKISDLARPPRALTFAEAIYPFEVDGVGRAHLCVPLPELQLQAEFQRRWLIDARAAVARPPSALERVLDAGQTGGVVWRVVPERRGWTAGALLRRGRSTDAPLEPEPLKALGVTLAEALRQLHATRHAHGQLSVESVEIDAEGDVVVRGLPVEPSHHSARLSAVRAAVPPELLAPEQLLYDTCEARTDVYQLALVLLTLSTGGNPFVRRDRGQTIGAVCQGGDRLPGLARLPEALRDVLGAALRADPQERPSSDELRRELESAAPPPSERAGLLAGLVRQLSAGRPPPAPLAPPGELDDIGSRLAELARIPAPPALPPTVAPPRSRRALVLGLVAIVAFASGVGVPRVLAPPEPRVGPPAPVAHLDPSPPAPAATPVTQPVTSVTATVSASEPIAPEAPEPVLAAASVAERPARVASTLPRAAPPGAASALPTPETNTPVVVVEPASSAAPTAAAAIAGPALLGLTIEGSASQFVLHGETRGATRPLGYMVEDAGGGRYIIRLPGAANGAGLSALPVSTGAVQRITVHESDDGVTITLLPGPDGLGQPVLQRRSSGFDLRLP